MISISTPVLGQPEQVTSVTEKSAATSIAKVVTKCQHLPIDLEVHSFTTLMMMGVGKSKVQKMRTRELLGFLESSCRILPKTLKYMPFNSSTCV